MKLINTKFDILEIGEKNCHTFFGYYDITPFRGEKILYHEAPNYHTPAKIILNNINGKDRRVLATTNAWNTQQGSRLRWMPNQEDVICFNDYLDGKYVSRILNIENGKERVIPIPLYDVTKDGKYGVSLNFERLGVLRPGYGYVNRSYEPPKDLSTEGITLVNLETGELNKVLTYNDILKVMSDEEADCSKCYINHLSFSPDGSKFLFFWIKNIDNWAEASLMVYNIPQKRLYIHEKDKRASHYAWIDNETILCTATTGRPPLAQCRYYLYKENHIRTDYGHNILLNDGHPTIYKDNKIMSDTYPNKYMFQELFIYDADSNEKKQLVNIFSKPVSCEEFRTDLHPRFNEDKSIICFDANVTGYRHIYILKNWYK